MAFPFGIYYGFHYKDRATAMNKTEYRSKSEQSHLDLSHGIAQIELLWNGICFNLDKFSLAAIERAKTDNSQLYLSPKQQADLRCYILFEGQNYLFSTYYEEEAIVRSLIFFDGEIIHQISNNSLEEVEFVGKITTAHYWLIEQIIEQVNFDSDSGIAKGWLNLLPWGLSCLIVLITVLINLAQFLSLPFWLILLAPLLMCWLLQLGIKRLLRKLLPY